MRTAPIATSSTLAAIPVLLLHLVSRQTFAGDAKRAGNGLFQAFNLVAGAV